MAAVFVALIVFANWSYADVLETWTWRNHLWHILFHQLSAVLLLAIGFAQLGLTYLIR